MLALASGVLVGLFVVPFAVMVVLLCQAALVPRVGEDDQL